MENIVISGISGRLPESDNVEEFASKLFSGVNFITNDGRRWTPGLYGNTFYMSKLKDLKHFDATFFGIDDKLAHSMSAEERILLEVTHEAIIDAGINPEDLRGSRIGVFLACGSTETSLYWRSAPERVNEKTLLTSNTNALANKISYYFHVTGPAYSVDTACSSSMYALQQAFNAVKTNQCDAAIVATANICLCPTYSLQFQRMNMLSKTGKCSVFDASCDGYVRGEAVVSVYVQKEKEAKRVYATILNAMTNTDGYKVEGITFPSGEMQKNLLQQVYSKVNINPVDVSYVEAHGTGTPVGDPEETNSIADFFCEDRAAPLLIGSIKSNMGHSEPASGLCALLKVLMAMETSVIPPNLHFKEPNPLIPALINGRLKVVDKPTKFNGGLVGMNSFGFGGANAHVLLNWNSKSKTPAVADGLPRIIMFSGRTEKGVTRSLEKIEKMPADDEFVSLLHGVHRNNIRGHIFRGFTVLGGSSIVREVKRYDGKKRPVWFVFSGPGPLCPGMAKDMMQLPVFQNSVHKCAEALKPEGVDLLELVLDATEETYSSTVNSFVVNVAVQIALVDVLRTLGITPEGIVGLSTGELACAYADGSLTAEQTVLAAYFLGKGLIDCKLPSRSMIDVELSPEEVAQKMPSEIDIACIWGSKHVTLSGPQKEIERFKVFLENDGIRATKVESTGIAFPSRYVKTASPLLTKYLEKVIPCPKKRSSRWISSSVPDTHWGTSSAAYYVNSLLSPVMFQKALVHIPHDTVVIQVGPSSFLTTILERLLPHTCTTIELAENKREKNIDCLFSSFGKMYNAGLQPDLVQFHPTVNYPVSRGTPMIAPLVNWDHSQEWDLPVYEKTGSSIGQRGFEIDLRKEDDEFLAGHTIDGRILFPATGYLELVWKTFISLRGEENFASLPVVFENVQFHRATIMSKEGAVVFQVNIFNGSGAFEVCTSGSLAVSGRIYAPDNVQKEMLDHSFPSEYCNTADYLPLTSTDIYKDLRLRGYEYDGIFKGIIAADNKCLSGELCWCKNWVTFMDTLLQFSILQRNTKELYLPTMIERVVIDPRKQGALVDGVPVPVHMYQSINLLKSGGVEVHGLKASLAPRRQQSHAQPILEEYCFSPYIDNLEKQVLSTQKNEDALALSIKIFLENLHNVVKVNIVELNTKPDGNLLAPKVLNILETEPMIQVAYTVASPLSEEYYKEHSYKELGLKFIHSDSILASLSDKSLHLIIARNNFELMAKTKEKLSNIINGDVFILLEREAALYKHENNYEGLQLLTSQHGNDRVYFLLRKSRELKSPIVVHMADGNFKWLARLKCGMKKAESEGCRVVLMSQRDNLSGILGLVNCIKQEPGGHNLRCFFLQDENAPLFSVDNQLYDSQIRKDLVINVYNNGKWGCYRHFKIQEQSVAEVEHAYINTLNRGDLASLRWIEGPLTYYTPTLYPSAPLCCVYYAALNFKDVMLATGKLSADSLPVDIASQECVLGIEFSGRDTSGRRLMGTVPACGLATTVLADPYFLWEVPETWSLEDAATVPTVYATSYYALIVRGRMRPGETLLVHAGSGGVGQASISIALNMGVTVFTTVGSPEKRAFLKQRFPQLTDRNIFNSRDTTFEKHVMKQTAGRGVDLVLNSLADDKLQASVRCLASHGRFLEIGKFDLNSNTNLGLSAFSGNKTFHGVLVDTLFSHDSIEKRETVRLLNEGIKSGAVVPLPRTVFSENEIEKAFRFMATGKHIGKVMLKIRCEEPDKVSLSSVKLVPAIPRTYMNPQKVYVIVGGLGGIGLQLANWLVQRGATKIVLTSRSGVRTGYQSLCIRRWKELGVTVLVSTINCYTENATIQLLKDAKKLGDVGGIFNLAVVLKDALFENQTKADFKVVYQSKVDTTSNLDTLSRILCPKLDHFVVFSSVSCGRGNAGQSNYGLANSVMERICESRHKVGLPALVIQWGAVGEVGLVAETLSDKVSIRGTLPQRISSCLHTLDIFLLQPHTVVSSIVLADKKPDSGQAGVLRSVANILGIKDLKKVNGQATLADLGMDSLMAAEIKQVLERSYSVMLDPQDIRKLTFDKLSQEVNSVIDSSCEYAPDAIHAVAEVKMPTEVMVKLPSQAAEGALQPPLFLVHPIEGVTTCLEPLAAELPLPVWGLQCTAEAPLTSVQHLAAFYLQHVKKVHPKGHYNLGAYSYGTTVAFEMALQLENMGERVSLFLLDGSPSWIPTYVENLRPANKTPDSNKDETIVLAYFVSHYLDLDINEVRKNLSAASNFEERLSLLGQLLAGNKECSSEQVVATANSFYKKIVAAISYKPAGKFEGNITLFRAKTSLLNIGYDYDLSEVCNSGVDVYTLESSHKNFLQASCIEEIAPVISIATSMNKNEHSAYDNKNESDVFKI